MVGANLAEAMAGLFLVFFVPGYTLTKATFPEWRIRGPDALLRLVETVTLALVLSVVLTILVGYVLLAGAPGGFQAYWSDPVLETSLAAIAVVAFVFGWFRGAYRRDPPPAPTLETDAGEEGAWELTRELERLGREERRLNHLLRTRGGDPVAAGQVRDELNNIRSLRAQLQERREAQYGT
jgi:hypothetical protein